MKINTSLGIKKAMLSAGMSQRELAKRAGWSDQWAWTVCNKEVVSVSTLETIARILDVRVSDIIKESEV